MDWMNRGNRPQAAQQPAGTNAAGAPHAPAHHSASTSGKNSWKSLRWASVALLFSVTVLVLALIAQIALGGTNSESKHVDSKRLQAVFLNGGQVYFGRIKTLNSQYMRVSDIYYLRVNQQVQPNQQNSQANNDISLVKLGCELHGPQDSMVINREQVIFWENLKDDGQVAKAVAEYVKQNPNGQKCDQPQAQQQNTPTTPTPTTPTNKKP